MSRFEWIDYLSSTFDHLSEHWLQRLQEDCNSEANVMLVDSITRDMLWKLCEVLGAKDQGIPAQACRIFEIYISIKMNRDAHTFMENDQLIYQRWLAFKEAEGEKLLLYMAVCIQLASKMNATRRPISTRKIKRMLLAKGSIFSMKEITTVEFQIFQSLDFRLPLWTSLEVGELLGKLAGVPSETFNVIDNTICFAEFNRKDIQQDVQSIGGLDPTTDREERPLRTLHLVAGAVAVVVKITRQWERVDTTPESLLAGMTHASETLIKCVSKVILEYIMSSEDDE